METEEASRTSKFCSICSIEVHANMSLKDHMKECHEFVNHSNDNGNAKSKGQIFVRTDLGKFENDSVSEPIKDSSAPKQTKKSRKSKPVKSANNIEVKKKTRGRKRAITPLIQSALCKKMKPSKAKSILKVQLPVKSKQKKKQTSNKAQSSKHIEDEDDKDKEIVASEFDGKDLVIIYADGSREKFSNFTFPQDQNTEQLLFKDESVKEDSNKKRKTTVTQQSETFSKGNEKSFLNWLKVNVACKATISNNAYNLESDINYPKRARRKQSTPRRRDTHIADATVNYISKESETSDNDTRSSVNDDKTEDDSEILGEVNQKHSDNQGTSEKHSQKNGSKQSYLLYLKSQIPENRSLSATIEDVYAGNTEETPNDSEERADCSQRDAKISKKSMKIGQKNVEKVVCGACKQEFISKSTFTYHIYQFHMGMARREGESQEFTDEEIKQAFRKAFKVLNYVRCLKCDRKLNSLVSLNYHQGVCGVKYEERAVKCQICRATLLPVSMKTHMKKHIKVERVTSSSGSREKRKSATLALQKLQSFSGDSITPNDKDEDFVNTPSDEENDNDSYEPEWGTDAGQNRNDDISDLGSFYNVTVASISLPNQIPGSLQSAWKKEFEGTGAATCRNPFCGAVFDTISDLSEHYWICDCIPKAKTFNCKLCSFSSHHEVEIKNHAKKHQAENLTRFEDQELVAAELLELEEPMRPRKKSRRDPQPMEVFVDAPLWAVQKKLAHTAKVKLFPDIKFNPSSWKDLQADKCSEYLPETSTSIHFRVASNSEDVSDDSEAWTTLERLTSKVEDGKPIMFFGGPVWASSWCPKAESDSLGPNYLAVSAFLKMDAVYKTGECPGGPGSIQLWKMESLSLKGEASPPNISYCVAHDHGCAWTMEWCPSGARQALTDDGDLLEGRLGLLAAGYTDGTVRIYAMPWPEQLFRSSDQSNSGRKVFKKDADITLRPYPSDEEGGKGQVLKLAWFGGHTHRYIAAGLSNGVVCVWDLNTKSVLLRLNEGGAQVLRPFLSFPAHQSAVTGLSFYGDGVDTHLITCSSDRSQKFWDLRDTVIPASIHKKGLYTDTQWATAWPGAVTCFDDSLGLQHTASVYVDSGFYNFIQRPMMVQNSPVWSISYNPWYNVAIQGDEAGEVTCNVLPNMRNSVDCDKGYVKRRVPISHVDCIEAPGSNEATSGSIEKMCKQLRYAGKADCKLLFRDEPLHNFKSIPKEAFEPLRLSEKMKSSPSPEFPITAVNRVCWNPNLGSEVWVFIGYQCGLGRLLCLTSLTQKVKAEEVYNIASNNQHN